MHTEPNMEFLLARNYLMSLENQILLRTNIDFHSITDVCSTYSDDFTKYHNSKQTPNNRLALPLVTDLSTGSFDELHAINRNEMEFTDHTIYLEKMPTLVKFLQQFEDGYGRSHIIKFGPGGFFPPHRDGPNSDLYSETFRIFLAIKNCGPYDFAFLFDDKRLPMRDGEAYFLNSSKLHSAVCFNRNETLCAVINIKISIKNIKKIIEMSA